MKKHNSLESTNSDNVKRFYILTRPTKLSDMAIDEIDDDYSEHGWREKSRQLQARRWRKIRHQLA
jgi:hypothetical protein